MKNQHDLAILAKKYSRICPKIEGRKLEKIIKRLNFSKG